VLTLLMVTMVGCASTQRYDSVLWRQIRAEQSVISDELHRPTQLLTRDVLMERLSTVAVVWESGEAPPRFASTEPASIVHDIRDAGVDDYGDPVLEFTAFVSSGVRPEVSKDDGWKYTGPSTVYTCYTWEVVFVADRVWDARMTGYAEDTDLECDERLIARLPQDATHIATADLVG